MTLINTHSAHCSMKNTSFITSQIIILLQCYWFSSIRGLMHKWHHQQFFFFIYKTSRFHVGVGLLRNKNVTKYDTDPLKRGSPNIHWSTKFKLITATFFKWNHWARLIVKIWNKNQVNKQTRPPHCDVICFNIQYLFTNLSITICKETFQINNSPLILADAM